MVVQIVAVGDDDDGRVGQRWVAHQLADVEGHQQAFARALGVPVRRARTLALLAVGLIAASSVAVCGVVGWVGLVVPHLVRMAFGTDHRSFMLNTLLAGAIYLVLVDTLARSVSEVEIPLGVLTALLGAPLFAFLVRRLGRSLHG